jgi:hypothetical protein
VLRPRVLDAPTQRTQTGGAAPSAAPCAILMSRGFMLPVAAKRRRTRVLLACTPCRVARVKCSGEQPTCDRCALFERPCAYEKPPSKDVTHLTPLISTGFSLPGHANGASSLVFFLDDDNFERAALGARIPRPTALVHPHADAPLHSSRDMTWALYSTLINATWRNFISEDQIFRSPPTATTHLLNKVVAAFITRAMGNRSEVADVVREARAMAAEHYDVLGDPDVAAAFLGLGIYYAGDNSKLASHYLLIAASQLNAIAASSMRELRDAICPHCANVLAAVVPPPPPGQSQGQSQFQIHTSSNGCASAVCLLRRVVVNKVHEMLSLSKAISSSVRSDPTTIALWDLESSSRARRSVGEAIARRVIFDEISDPDAATATRRLALAASSADVTDVPPPPPFEDLSDCVSGGLYKMRIAVLDRIVWDNVQHIIAIRNSVLRFRNALVSKFGAHDLSEAKRREIDEFRASHGEPMLHDLAVLDLEAFIKQKISALFNFAALPVVVTKMAIYDVLAEYELAVKCADEIVAVCVHAKRQLRFAPYYVVFTLAVAATLMAQMRRLALDTTRVEAAVARPSVELVPHIDELLGEVKERLTLLSDVYESAQKALEALEAA